MRPCPRSTSTRASTTSSWNATRSSCTTRWPASRRTRAAPTRSGGSPATSGGTPRSGRRKLRELGATVPAAGPAADARPVHHRRRPAARHRPRWPTWSRRSRATRRACTTPRARRPRWPPSPPTSASTPIIWDQLKAGDQFGDVTGGWPGRRGHRRPGHQRRRDRQPREPGIAPAAGPGRSARSSSGSATASSATSRWSWAWPVPHPATRASSCSPGSPACSPGRSAWPPASTSRCRASASCSSARSRSSGPRWRRCPRRRRPSWPPPTGPRASRPTRPRRSPIGSSRDPETALDTLVREELGLDPDELGSPWGAAAGSFVAFAIGAVIPVIPYLFGGGTAVLLVSLGLSLVALFAVGAAVSLLTGRGLIFSGFRQLGIGLAAALVTYAIGSIIGVGAG